MILDSILVSINQKSNCTRQLLIIKKSYSVVLYFPIKSWRISTIFIARMVKSENKNPTTTS